MFGHLIARATSRIAGGDALRRNEEWQAIASSYSTNVGLVILLLRPFPDFLRPFVARFLPPVRQMKQQLQSAKKLFTPIVEQRRTAEAANDPAYQKPDDFLQWMMDGVEDEQDFDPEMLAHHMLVLISMAAIHTSSITLTQALYDLIARPEYLQPLREEIQVTLQSGWENATKASLDAQRRLDSFMRESQRFNSIGDLSMHRIVKKSLTLSDGLILPEGTHICFPAGPMSRDSSLVANASNFDGLQWCKESTDRNALKSVHYDTAMDGIDDASPHRSQLTSTTSTSYISLSPAAMHFGYGRQACPGRFFAGCMIKAILSRILMDYDFKFENGRAGWRPANLYVGEHILPNIHLTVLLRKRKLDL
ncbi:Periodic tryptophan protein 2 [Penicillium cosmopolitanum]|uniref:Periodic tryptophan protein 2 n=1 Tax=Penicillium cosmopolitanum TaxID=1131564 RepID=A0A9W9VE73_9EURO|nr:Periodic tryptophan protein 2 [Penicillium cosmopolitanum]KAJ5378863.1 Periodic tryptophan protein 2 [Penicillium cosmopolitanum]